MTTYLSQTFSLELFLLPLHFLTAHLQFLIQLEEIMNMVKSLNLSFIARCMMGGSETKSSENVVW